MNYIKLPREKENIKKKSVATAANIEKALKMDIIKNNVNICFLLPSGEWLNLEEQSEKELIENVNNSVMKMLSNLSSDQKNVKDLTVLNSVDILNKNLLLSYIMSVIETTPKKYEIISAGETIESFINKENIIDSITYTFLSLYKKEIEELLEDYLESSKCELETLKQKRKLLEREISLMSKVLHGFESYYNLENTPSLIDNNKNDFLRKKFTPKLIALFSKDNKENYQSLEEAIAEPKYGSEPVGFTYKK